MEWFIFTVGLILLFILGVSYYAYRRAFYHAKPRPGKKEKQDTTYADESGAFRELAEKLRGWTEELSRVPFEEVYIRSEDGKRLFGRYYHVRDGAPLQIEFHGYKGGAIRDFCGGDPFARRLGFNTLLVDQRSHGGSDGNAITFGVLERHDCLAWANYAVERFGSEVKIILTGISMGAATVLMASDLELPENVVGIIADSPYSSPKEILQKVCGDLRLPSRAIYPFLWLGALLFGRFRIRGGAIESVTRARIPILILHGEGDGFVPCDMSRRICDACASDVTCVTFSGADHCLGYVVEPKAYEEAIEDFVEKCFGTRTV